jgi:hydroxylamine reductase
MPITKDTIIGHLLKDNPKSAEILFNNGMHCIGCQIAFSETIGQASEVHGIDIDKLLVDLNKLEYDKECN